MKKIILIFCLALIAYTACAAGQYEVGSMSVEDTTCKWTSSVKRNCTKEAMMAIQKRFDACFSPKTKRASHCADTACIKKTLNEAAASCCRQTGGHVQ